MGYLSQNLCDWSFLRNAFSSDTFSIKNVHSIPYEINLRMTLQKHIFSLETPMITGFTPSIMAICLPRTRSMHLLRAAAYLQFFPSLMSRILSGYFALYVLATAYVSSSEQSSQRRSSQFGKG